MDPRFLVFIFAIGAASAFLASFDNCSDKCTVHEIRVEPCNSKRYCRFKLGTNASMSFDFTPNFVAQNLNTALFSDEFDAKLDTIGNNGIVEACALTPCPTESGRKQTLDYVLHIAKRLPKGVHRFRWHVWNTDNESDLCCFKTNIKLV